MAIGLWGKKIGMSQVFSDSDNKVAPVTVIDCAHWFVTNVKTQERDGYQSVQVGCVRDRYAQEKFSQLWLKQSKKYFLKLREIKLDGDLGDIKIGQDADFYSMLSKGDKVDIAGNTKGCGFAGVVRRYNFGGPPGSHGSSMGKKPGSIGSFCSQGKVIKGKKMPGRMGNRQRVVRNLEIINIKPEEKLMVVKGAVPGKTGSIVFIKEARVKLKKAQVKK